MIRVRVPGGAATAAQWQRMDELADEYGNGSIKLTTRQAFQLHGVLKRDLKATIAGFNETLLDSIAGCGDVNRNVMCNPNPHESAVHGQVYAVATAISAHLTPRSTAYWELWLNGEPQPNGSAETEDTEPIYGKNLPAPQVQKLRWRCRLTTTPTSSPTTSASLPSRKTGRCAASTWPWAAGWA
jgi:sulfite reductase (NADPH) hemoprotein beta-component